MFTLTTFFDIIIVREGDVMKLSEIIETSDIFTDENLDDEGLLRIANTGISRINNECGTVFPFFENTSTDYTAIPKYWIKTLITYYMSYGVKMNDTALSEADRYLDEFYKCLQLFKENLYGMVDKFDKGDISNGISSEFIITEGLGGVYGIETSGAINVGYFGNMSNGGSF